MEKCCEQSAREAEAEAERPTGIRGRLPHYALRTTTAVCGAQCSTQLSKRRRASQMAIAANSLESRVSACGTDNCHLVQQRALPLVASLRAIALRPCDPATLRRSSGHFAILLTCPDLPFSQATWTSIL